MAQPKSSRRRKKRRGTQGGSVDTRGRTRRPQSRDEARAQARSKSRKKGTQRAVHGRMQPPTWKRAITLGGIAAVCVFIMVGVIQKGPVDGSIGVALISFVIYTPALFYFESFMYRRRLAKAQRDREAKQRNK